MQLKLGPDAERLIEEQLKSHRYSDAESVVLAGLASLAARGPNEFASGEMQSLLAEGELSIERDGAIDGEEAFHARRAARGQRGSGAA